MPKFLLGIDLMERDLPASKRCQTVEWHRGRRKMYETRTDLECRLLCGISQPPKKNNHLSEIFQFTLNKNRWIKRMKIDTFPQSSISRHHPRQLVAMEFTATK